MKTYFSRRDALKLAVAGLATTSVSCKSTNTKTGVNTVNAKVSETVDTWQNTHDRVWLGGQYWANPMEDWEIVNGQAQCTSAGGNRSVHSLTSQIVDANGTIEMSVVVHRYINGNNDGGGGLRLGVRSELNEYKSNCFVQKGVDAGIRGNSLVLNGRSVDLSPVPSTNKVLLKLKGVSGNGTTKLSAVALDTENKEVLASIETWVASAELLGNVAVVSHFSKPSEGGEPNTSADAKKDTKYAFSEWTISGSAFSHSPEHQFGPILWAMYTLNDSRSEEGFIMKLSAFTGPMGKNDSQQVELQLLENGVWKTKAFAPLDPLAWVATFRIPNWHEKAQIKYRLVYIEKRRDGSIEADTFTGTIRANPQKATLRMAALTCQNDYAFPYEPVANNITNLEPDLILFSGDQIYEEHGGFGFVRSPAKPAINCYLRKFYQFGWAFKDSMRNAPTVCLPDDHDVFQGNLWGEGGAAMAEKFVKTGRSDGWGGYIQPIPMLEVVHRTHTAHHPDPVEPAPSKRGISVYYTDLVYGNVSFAIIADRHWKSGPETLDIVVGETGEGEAPTYINPQYDRPDLSLLGNRQENFLKRWGKDWRGHTLKAVLSQTVFAGISTHQPLPTRYLKYDFDSSGWPAGARNRAIEIMRESKALHICGDTHLGSLSQYGLNEHRDSNWAFCTPAIAAGWPRWWRPDDVGIPFQNRPSHGLDQTGEYLDSFGNKIYVYAVGNPQIGQSENRYIKAHEKGSGFGFITFDTENKTYTLDAYRFLVDAVNASDRDQFPGWPATIHQMENKGENKLS